MCGARGAKLSDERLVHDLPFRFDYCGRCGRNWPAQLSHVEADGQPPTDDDQPIPAPVEDRPAIFGARVAQVAERVKGQILDFKHAQGNDR